jgi:hypothetical protein
MSEIKKARAVVPGLPFIAHDERCTLEAFNAIELDLK